MGQVLRFGVSMDAELLAAFDTFINNKGYDNRSEALRDLVRDAIVQSDWVTQTAPAVAVLCLVGDPQARETAAKLAGVRRDHPDWIASSLQVPLDRQSCLEVIVLRGPARDLQKLGDRIIASRGVKHGKLVLTTTGERLH